MNTFNQCFLFLRHPSGGVEDVAAMRAAGFTAIFCNIGDFEPAAWVTVRDRAKTAGVVCGPWARTADAANNFVPEVIDKIKACAAAWGDTPYIVNSESELKGSGRLLTQLIAAKIGTDDAAVSMEPRPFANVDWTPLANIPILPQMFGPSGAISFDATKQEWHDYGIKCVYFTFGADRIPDFYKRQASYSVYTADDMGGNYWAWAPTSYGYDCKESDAMEWYEKDWRKPVGAPAAQFPRALYPPDATTPSKAGPDVIAYKRAISRAGRWPWAQFNADYTNAFAHGKSSNVGDSGVAGMQRQYSISPTGNLGKATFDVLRTSVVSAGLPHEGEYLFDPVCLNLLEEAYQIAHPPLPTKEDVLAVMADYMRRSVINKANIFYSQARPMTHLGKSPDSSFTTDCSGGATGIYYWARKQTGVAVPDPNHRGYDGYGFTGSLIVNPRAPAGNYEIGDLALYGPSGYNTHHVVICYKGGSASTSVWWSHGSGSGPVLVRVNYRGDLLWVVRPKKMP